MSSSIRWSILVRSSTGTHELFRLEWFRLFWWTMCRRRSMQPTIPVFLLWRWSRESRWFSRCFGVVSRKNHSVILCSCARQYSVDECSYHQDRLSVVLHANLSSSILLQQSVSVFIFVSNFIFHVLTNNHQSSVFGDIPSASPIFTFRVSTKFFISLHLLFIIEVRVIRMNTSIFLERISRQRILLGKINHAFKVIAIQPKSRSLLQGDYSSPFSLSTLNRYGQRCTTEHDGSLSHPCQNNGSCFFYSQFHRDICVCHKEYQESRSQITLYARARWWLFSSAGVLLSMFFVRVGFSFVLEYIRVSRVSLTLLVICRQTSVHSSLDRAHKSVIFPIHVLNMHR